LSASSLGCAAGGVCSVTPGISLANTTYVWFVNATNANGTSAWSDGKTITVNAPGANSPPNTPTPVSPSGTVTTTTPTYSWNASQGSQTYELLVQNTQGVAVDVIVSASQANCDLGNGTCSFRPATALRDDTMYNWFVKASNQNGDSAWSSPMAIAVDTGETTPGGPPAAPTMTAPGSTVNTTTPTYAWNAVAGASSYELLVQNTQGVAVYLVLSPTDANCPGDLPSCSFTPSQALTGGSTYNAFVRASNTFGTGAWSAPRTFTVGGTSGAPSAPTTISPSGSTGTVMPTYTWNASPGATSYYLLVQNTQGVAVSTSMSAAFAGCGSGSGTCSFTPSSPLASGTTYVWFVNASNAQGTSDWSAGRQIRTP